MASYFEPLIMAAIGTASKILSSQQQMAVLDQTKTLTESALQMLYTAKEAGGNPKVLKLAVIIYSPLDNPAKGHFNFETGSWSFTKTIITTTTTITIMWCSVENNLIII